MKRRRNPNLNVKHLTLVRLRRDVNMKSTIPQLAGVRGCMNAVSAGRHVRSLTFISGGTVAMVGGRLLKQRTNEGLATVLVSPQHLSGLLIFPYLIFLDVLHSKLDQAAVPYTQLCHCVPHPDPKDQVLCHILQ